VSPMQMFVPAFTPLRFEVTKATTTVENDGKHAMVDVYGPDPATQHAKLPLEREGESWRLMIAISP
jgi:hypothetical protein